MEVPLKFCSLSLSLSKAAGIGKIAHQSRTGRKRLAEIREEEKKSRMRNHFFAQYNIYIELLTLVVYFFSLWQKVTSNSLDHWFFFFQFFYLNSLPCVCVCASLFASLPATKKLVSLVCRLQQLPQLSFLLLFSFLFSFSIYQASQLRLCSNFPSLYFS